MGEHTKLILETRNYRVISRADGSITVEKQRRGAATGEVFWEEDFHLCSSNNDEVNLRDQFIKELLNLFK